jgi:hypothetical protein
MWNGKKVFYAKNDHGNHLKDGHPPDYGIHHLSIYLFIYLVVILLVWLCAQNRLCLEFLNYFDLLPILRHFRPIYAILRQQPCNNKSSLLKYTIWGTCKFQRPSSNGLEMAIRSKKEVKIRFQLPFRRLLEIVRYCLIL